MAVAIEKLQRAETEIDPLEKKHLHGESIRHISSAKGAVGSQQVLAFIALLLSITSTLFFLQRPRDKIKGP